MNTQAPIGSVSLEAKVIRADGSVEDLGTLAYWNKSRWRRWWWQLTHKTRR